MDILRKHITLTAVYLSKIEQENKELKLANTQINKKVDGYFKENQELQSKFLLEKNVSEHNRKENKELNNKCEQYFKEKLKLAEQIEELKKGLSKCKLQQ